MIDRKALWISALIIIAMIGASFWRLSLLPDWSHFPVNGPGDPQSRASIWLFTGPLSLLLVMAMQFARKYFASGPQENIQSWQRWNATMLIPYAAIAAVMQSFIIARSLGFGAGADRVTLSHGVLVVMGVMLVMLGNAMPKLPWLSMRFRPFRLDPWQWNRHLRFMGKIIVGFGLFVAIGGPLLPPEWFRNISLGLWLAMLAAGIVYRIKLRREPSPLS